jgi:hypothetical protein
MKTKLLLLIACFAFIGGIKAQDVLYKFDGSKEKVIIKEINEKDIVYKLFDNQNGPDYRISRNDVLMVTYQNDTFEIINKSLVNDRTVARNIFSYNLFDLVWNSFTVSYECIFENGKTGLKIPLSLGYNYNDEYTNFDFRNIIASGVGINFYPTGQGKWKYFMGPQIKLGLGKEQEYYYYYDEFGNYIGEEVKGVESFYGKFFIDNGIMFTPVTNFSLAAFVSLGVRYVAKSNYDNDGINTDGAFGVNLSYRF